MTDERDIITLYKEGRQEYAFNLLVRKYSERLYWHIRKLTCDHDDANDLLQITLVKAWQNLPAFREDSKLYTWLYRIATNETISFLRKKQLRSFLLLSNYDKILKNKLQADKYFNGDKLQLALQREINKLPLKQKAVFTLRYFQQLKYEDISEILDTSVGALKASYHHAYYKIKTALENEFE